MNETLYIRIMYSITNIKITTIQQQQIASDTFLYLTSSLLMAARLRWNLVCMHHFHDNYMFPRRLYVLNNNKYTFLEITSSLLKLANGSTHGDETCYTYELHIVFMTPTYRFNNFRPLLLHSSHLLMAAHMEKKVGTHAYYIISTTTTGIFLYY